MTPPSLRFGPWETLAAVRQHLRLIGAVTLAGLAVGLFISWRSPVQYEAVATVLLVPAKGRLQPALQVQAASVSRFGVLVKSSKVIEPVVRANSLDRSPYSLDVRAFAARQVWVEEVKGITALKVHVALGDPTLAATVANGIVQGAVAATQQLLLAPDQLLALREKALALQAEVSGLKEKIESTQRHLHDSETLELLLDAEHSRLQSIKAEIRRRAPQDTPALNAALESQAVASQAAIAALERRRAELAKATPRDGMLAAEQNVLAERSADMDRAQKDLRDAELSLGERWDYQIVDRAVPPPQPVSRGTTANAVAGVLAGCLFTAFGAVLFELVRIPSTTRIEPT